MKVGQRVQLKFNPSHGGTVSAVTPDGRFRVSWDSHGRTPRQPRVRLWYGPDALPNILAGHPEA